MEAIVLRPGPLCGKECVTGDILTAEELATIPQQNLAALERQGLFRLVFPTEQAAQLLAIRKENEELKSQLIAIRKENEELKSQLIAIRKENEELGDELEDVAKRISALEGQFKSANQALTQQVKPVAEDKPSIKKD